MQNTHTINAEVIVCVPAYNEAEIIAESLKKIWDELSRLPSSWHIVVCDNGSTDGTAQEVTDCALPNVTLLTVAQKGKGAAVRAGALFARARGAEFFGFIDADISPHPKHFIEFYQLLKSGHADSVIGSRFIDAKRVQRTPFRTITSKLFNWGRRFFFSIPVSDTQCGLKMFNQRAMDVLAECREVTWFIDTEFLAYAHARGLRILERPVEWNEYLFPGRGSKLRFIRDGVRAGFAMFRIRYRMMRDS